MSNEKLIFPLIDAETKAWGGHTCMQWQNQNLNLVFLIPKQGSFQYTSDAYHNDIGISVVLIFQCAFVKEKVCGT